MNFADTKYTWEELITIQEYYIIHKMRRILEEDVKFCRISFPSVSNLRSCFVAGLVHEF